MTVRSGLSYSVIATFDDGHPDGAVAWTVRDSTGVIDSGSITPSISDVSSVITATGSANTLADGIYTAPREIEWSYTVGGKAIHGSEKYTLEARVPGGPTADGVRNKLGVSRAELPDSDVPLIGAYLEFQSLVGSSVLSSAYDGGLKEVAARDAVEAIAARRLVPSMQIRVASSEESGTNKFKRQTVDWAMLVQSLDDLINAGQAALVSGFDPTVDFGSIFILAPPSTDAITGV